MDEKLEREMDRVVAAARDAEERWMEGEVYALMRIRDALHKLMYNVTAHREGDADLVQLRKEITVVTQRATDLIDHYTRRIQ